MSTLPPNQPKPTPTKPPADRNPCRCEAYIDLSNNTRFCPTRGTLDALANGVLETLVTESNIEISCLRSDFTVAGLRDYLRDPANYIDAIPAAPPSSKRARSSSAAPKTLPGSKLTPAAAAGVVVGVVALVGVIGALGWFVGRPLWQERRATGFFRTKELDGQPAGPLGALGGPGGAPAMQHSPSDAAMAAFEAGWGRYAQNGNGGGGGGRGGGGSAV
jgi:hypothetical protein